MKYSIFRPLLVLPFVMIGIFISYPKVLAQQSTLPDSILRKFHAEKNLDQRFEFLIDRANQELSASLSNNIALYGIFLADSLKDRHKLARAYEVYGISFNKKGDYISGIENLGQALQLFEQLKSLEDVAKIKRTMGETFRQVKTIHLLWIISINR